MLWTFHGMPACLDWRLDFTWNIMEVEMTYGLARFYTGIYLFTMYYYNLVYFNGNIFIKETYMNWS